MRPLAGHRDRDHEVRHCSPAELVVAAAAREVAPLVLHDRVASRISSCHARARDVPTRRPCSAAAGGEPTCSAAADGGLACSAAADGGSACSAAASDDTCPGAAASSAFGRGTAPAPRDAAAAGAAADGTAAAAAAVVVVAAVGGACDRPCASVDDDL